MKNIALGKPAIQTSTYSNLFASHAVDGSRFGMLNVINNMFHCAEVGHIDTTNATWVVDLGKEHSVSHVAVTNRGDCCGMY